MSEQINKVLASTAQAFSTAEKKQARDNIEAQASGDYVSASVMSAYLPFSAISADADSAITSINGSSVGNFTGISAGNCISGSGTSASPLGLSSRIFFTDGTASAYFGSEGAAMSATPYTSTYYRVSAWNIHSTGSDTHSREVGANCSGIGIDWDSNYYHMDIMASGIETWDGWYPSRNHASYTHTGAQQSAYDGQTSVWDESSLMFKHSASGGWRTVDISSIDRWNSYSANQAGWNESANSLSTGYGGSQATAASQFNAGAGNWACRRVKCEGVPDQDLYGFQSRPNGTGTAYMVNPAGAFVQYQPNYFCKLYHKTGAAIDDLDSSIYPTGLTADARLDFVNLCSGNTANIKTDTFHGSTSYINPGQSATMWYIASADVWTDGTMDVPV